MKGKVLFHVLFWLAYWLAFAFINSRYDGDFQKYLVVEAMTLPFRIGAVYLSMFVLRKVKHQVGVAVALIGVIAIFGILYRCFKYFWLVPNYFPDSSIELWGYRGLYDILDIVMAVGVALSIWMYQHSQAQVHLTETLKSEKLAAELMALKNQIHPHFLFNTINNIYGLARQSSPNTAPATLKLSHLLRFVLYESQKERIALGTEWQIIKDYIELEKLRFEEGRLAINITKIVENEAFEMAPLLLLPLVENAFKHGASESISNATINININQSQQNLLFSVKNSKAPHGFSNVENGIGLSNLHRQLDLIYGHKATLKIDQNDKYFIATLNLHL